MREDETVAHVCWGCPAANDVWGGCKIKLQKCNIGGSDFSQIFQEVVSRCDRAEVELFAFVARCIWLRRNDFIHGGNFTHPTQVLIDSEKALIEFQKANARLQEGEPVEKDEAPIRWQPPVRDMVKLNWDASMDTKTKTIGLGVVIRDTNGSFLAAFSKRIHTEVSPVVA